MTRTARRGISWDYKRRVYCARISKFIRSPTFTNFNICRVPLSSKSSTTFIFTYLPTWYFGLYVPLYCELKLSERKGKVNELINILFLYNSHETAPSISIEVSQELPGSSTSGSAKSASVFLFCCSEWNCYKDGEMIVYLKQYFKILYHSLCFLFYWLFVEKYGFCLPSMVPVGEGS